MRQAIRRLLVRPYLNSGMELPAYFLHSSIEQAIESAVEHSDAMSHLNLAPMRIREILDRLQRVIGSPESPVVVVTTSSARYFLRQIVENSIANLVVIAHSEIPPGVKVASLGLIQ